MKEFLYLLFAIAPAAIWIYIFQRSDKGENEPKKLLFIAFFMGALVVIPVAYIEIFLTKEAIPHLFFGAEKAPAKSFFLFIIINFAVISIVEEFFKYLAVRLSVYYSDYFNEFSDGIIYMVVAAFGFSAFENFLYFINFGPDIILPRSVFTPLFHASTSAIIGRYLICAKYDKRESRKVIWAFIYASGVHLAYNLLVYSYGFLDNFWYMLAALLILALSAMWMFNKFTETEEIDVKSAINN